MWLATRENGRLLSFSTTKANNDYLDPHPVLVLPLDDIEGLTERVAKALWTHRQFPIADACYKEARADELQKQVNELIERL